MKTFLVVLTVLLFSTPFVAVYASGYPPGPTLVVGTTGAPALTENEAGGTFTVLYPNGQFASITETKVMLQVCGSTGGCTYISSSLTPVSAGTYAYSFPIPTGISGTVTIIVPAGSFTNTNDNTKTLFPNADTVIGTYTTPAGSPANTSSPSSSSAQHAQTPSIIRNAQQLTQKSPQQTNSQQQTSLLLLSTLAVLSVAGFALVIAPRKATTR